MGLRALSQETDWVAAASASETTTSTDSKMRALQELIAHWKWRGLRRGIILAAALWRIPRDVSQASTWTAPPLRRHGASTHERHH